MPTSLPRRARGSWERAGIARRLLLGCEAVPCSNTAPGGQQHPSSPGNHGEHLSWNPPLLSGSLMSLAWGVCPLKKQLHCCSGEKKNKNSSRLCCVCLHSSGETSRRSQGWAQPQGSCMSNSSLFTGDPERMFVGAGRRVGASEATHFALALGCRMPLLQGGAACRRFISLGYWELAAAASATIAICSPPLPRLPSCCLLCSSPDGDDLRHINNICWHSHLSPLLNSPFLNELCECNGNVKDNEQAEGASCFPQWASLHASMVLGTWDSSGHGVTLKHPIWLFLKQCIHLLLSCAVCFSEMDALPASCPSVLVVSAFVHCIVIIPATSKMRPSELLLHAPGLAQPELHQGDAQRPWLCIIPMSSLCNLEQTVSAVFPLTLLIFQSEADFKYRWSTKCGARPQLQANVIQIALQYAIHCFESKLQANICI